MGVNQQQSSDTTAIKGNVVQPLQFVVLKQESSSNRTKNDNTVELRRSKRYIKSIIDVFRAMGLRRTVGDFFLAKETVDLGMDAFYTVKNALESYFETSEGQVTALSLEELERYIMHNDLSKKLSENYWAINKSYDLLLGNQGMLLANQGLLLVNTGLLVGVAFMFMTINSKLDRNYEAILRLETKVDRNYDAIRRVENKVDRNLEVMLSRFKILEYNLTNVIERGFKDVIDFVRQTRIEGVTSELITFMKHFIQEKDTIRNLTYEQYITKLEEVNGILHRLQNSRMPQSGSLHTLLYNIINQRFAIPENSNDRVALTALGLLCSGTETYTSVMSFLLEEYSYLAHIYYQQNDLEKYNHYFSLVSTTFNDFKNSLAGENGLIDGIINILNEVKSYDFIKDERGDVVEFALNRIDRLNSVKSKLATITNLSQETPTEKIKYNFSNSQVKTPIGSWEDRRKVCYAVQFQSNGNTYQVGEWSTPARVYKKANPLLDIGTDPKGRTRLIFRKFDTDKPELVGIVEDSNKKEFRDINRDLYNAVLEPNEDIAIEEIEVFLENKADIHARYEGGRQAIHAAAENGNHNIMLTLKNSGADINARDANGYAPIHIAAGVGYENFIKDLVANGADVNAKTCLGRTALHVAAEKGHVNTVTSLMQIQGIDINAKDEREFTPLHMAASFGKNNVIASLSQDNRTDINAQSEVGFTPLHLAVIGEYYDAVKALLKSGKVDVNAKTQSGLTALHFASLIGNVVVAKHIMGHSGVNINEKSADGWTSLHLAINSQKENVSLELLATDNIEINAKGKDDLTPLHLAASSRQKDIAAKLLDRGALIENIDKYGYTPLHFAIESGDLDVVKCLVKTNANLYAERKDGYTPLGLAAYNGKLDIVQFLVNNKDVHVSTKNKNGMYPIDFGCSNGYFDIVEFLIDRGAEEGSSLHWAAYGGNLNIVRYLTDEKHFDLNKKDKYGNIPVHSAALRGHLNIVKFFIDQKQADLNTENNDGYTPFHFALLGGNLEAIKYFINDRNISLNAPPSKRDSNGFSVLHLSALNSNLGVIKYLIRKGADVKAIDDYGNTPLFPATSRGHLPMVKYLIQKGADFRAANTYGNTLLHFAVWNGHLELVKYYTEKGLELNATNENEDTPLHVASSLDIVKYLDEKGANLRAISKDGCTPLHINAANGNLDILKYLLEQGINIHARIIKSNEIRNNGKTALHLAAQNGRLDVVEYLIKEGADASFLNDDGQTSRDLANQHNHTDVVRFLEQIQLNLNLLNVVKQGNLHKVAEYVDLGANLKIKDTNGDTLQEIATRNGNIEIAELLKQKEMDLYLINAMKQHKLVLVKEYIGKGANLEAKDKDGNGLLYLSSASGYLDTVKHLVAEGANLHSTNGNGRTALHAAVEEGYLDIVKYLVEEGADLNAADNRGTCPLHLAVYFVGEKEVNFQVTDNSGNSPLHMTATNSRFDVVKYLVEKGANLEIKNSDNHSPLSLAAQNGHLATVKYLVEKGADPSALSGYLSAVRTIVDTRSITAPDIDGNTSLHLAASSGYLGIVKYLMSKDISLHTINKNGKTPLHVAAERGYLDIVKYFVEKGANLNAADRQGVMPLHYAALNDHLSIVKYFIDEKGISGGNIFDAVKNGYLGLIKYFIEKDSNTNVISSSGKTLLHIAAQEGKLNVIRYLIDKEVSINATDIDLNTPLHLAAENGNLDIVKCLVRKEAFINAVNREGITPLHYAALNDHLNVVKYLIEEKGVSSGNIFDAAENGYLGIVRYFIEEKGASLYATENRDGCPNTILHSAAENGHVEVVKYLVEERGINANVKRVRCNGSTAMEVAAREGKLDVIKYLVEGEYANKNIIENILNESMGYGASAGHLDVVKYLVEKGADVNGYFRLRQAVWSGKLEIVEYLVSMGADINGGPSSGKTPLDHAEWNGYYDIVNFLISKGARRSRRSIENDISVIKKKHATSSANKPSLWINILANAVAGAVRGVSGFISTTFELAIDMEHSQPSPKAKTAQSIDTNNTLLLLDVFIKKITGQKYVSTVDNRTPLLEARTYALNITTKFKEVLKDTAKRYGVSINESSFNYFKIYQAVESKMMSGELWKIQTILYSDVEEAYSKNEKFLSTFKYRIVKMLEGQQMINSNNEELGIASVDNKIPSSSLNSILQELPNSEGLKGITCEGKVAKSHVNYPNKGK